MNSYIIGLQRLFRQKWNYQISLLKRIIFGCPLKGLVNVIENHFSGQQSRGLGTNSHGVLSVADIKNLYNSKYLYMEPAIGMQTVIIFDLSLITMMHPGEIVTLKLNHIQKICIDGEHPWRLNSVLGCHRCRAKNHKCGLKSVKKRTMEVIIFNETYHENITVFQDICRYIELRVNCQTNSDRFCWYLGKKRRVKISGSMLSPWGITTFLILSKIHARRH